MLKLDGWHALHHQIRYIEPPPDYAIPGVRG
jgi:hypothetical protein